MGLLIDGKWRDRQPDTGATGGEFRRTETQFRSWITADGSSGFGPEAGRYLLYVSYACPWAHRTLVFRKLKKLEDVIDVAVVDPFMGDEGWWFGLSEGATGDPLYGSEHLHEIYTRARADYTGRVSVPVLWDKETRTIVNNESAEIIRMLNSAFHPLGDPTVDLYPEALREEIDEVNAVVYEHVNNGVYKCGFASSQRAYEEAYDALFRTLDWLEDRLGRQRYLVGSRVTEADWRLFTTLVRFDPVYVGHFKCNRNRLVDMPNLWNYLLELYQWPGIAETVNLTHIKRHYYESHESINPTRIVPKGPEIDYTERHNRGRLPAAA